MQEIWKDIIGYEGYYQVSNLCRIRSLDRIVGKNIRIKSRIMKTSTSKGGYKVICFRKNGKQVQYKVHRLIASSFIDNPYNKPFINHKDGNTSNNNLENLEWCTASENTQHAFDTGLCNAVGEKNGRATVTEEDVRQIRCMWKLRDQLSIDCGYKVNQTIIAKIFGVKLNIVHSIVRNKRWLSVK